MLFLPEGLGTNRIRRGDAATRRGLFHDQRVVPCVTEDAGDAEVVGACIQNLDDVEVEGFAGVIVTAETDAVLVEEPPVGVRVALP